MNFTLEKYFEKLKKYPINPKVVSLTDLPNDDGHTEKDFFLDTLIQKRNPYRHSSNEDEKEVKIDLLNKFLDQLKLKEKSERNRQIIEMRFIEELGNKEIGEKFGLTEAGISVIISKVLKKLKKLFEKQGYKVSHENKKN